MKLQTCVLWITVIAGLSVSGLPTPPAAAAEIGSKVAGFQLEDSTGEQWSLRALSGKIVAIVFWSYKCPVSLFYDVRVEELRKKYLDKDVVFIGIDSGFNESTDEIEANRTNRKMQIPILVDSDGNVAEKIGASHSPSIFILDREGILRYKGAMDNSKMPGEPGRVAYAENALDAILAGREIRPVETPPIGCSIRKRRSGG